MSSPSNKPYKSRLLNLINRYYIQFHSQLNVKFRELGYVIQGGLQKAVLPFFWLFQSGKKMGQVFSSGVVSPSALPGKFDHSISSSHSPADNLLEIVHQNITSNPLFSSLFPSKFQGLASQLKNKSIVIIVKKNRVRNLIAKNKQKNIKFIINNTLEKNKKLINKSVSKKNHKLLSILPTFSVRKKSANSSINSVNPGKNKESITSPQNNKLINTVDGFLSQFERLIIKNNATNNLIKTNLHNQDLNQITKAQNNLSLIKSEVVQDIIETSNHKLQEVLPIVRETTAKIVVKGVDQIQIVTNQFNKSIEEDPFQIKVLIAEAINYFFNQQKGKGLNSSISNKLFNSFSNTEVMKIDQKTNEPWLSWEDLYGSQKSLPADNIPHISPLKDDEQKVTTELNLTSELVHSIQIESKGDQDYTNEMIHIAKLIESTEISKKAITNSPKQSRQKTPSNSLHQIAKSKTNNIIKTESLSETLTSDQEEAIEAKVIEIKYEKHFLEIILDKLDQIILWLEEIFIKILATIKVLINEFQNNQN